MTQALPDTAESSLYRLLAVDASPTQGSLGVETIETKQVETVDNDRSFDLLQMIISKAG